MKYYIAIGSFVAVFGLGVLYFNFIAYPTFYFRYKLTVEVQTPDGVKSGSVVNEDEYSYHWMGREFLPGSSGGLIKGEAIFIDLGHGKNLVITNYADGDRPSPSRGNYSLDSGSLAFYFCDLPDTPPRCPDIPRSLRAGLANAKQKDAVAVDIRHLPTLLTFVDPTDYKTMQRIAPLEIEKVFGPGYAIKSVTVKITDEPLTDRIESQLPWLEKFRNINTALDGSRYLTRNAPVLSQVSYFYFKKIGGWR